MPKIDSTKAILWLLVFVVVLSFSALAVGLQKVQSASKAANHALCLQRDGYRDQVRQTTKYLRENPDGFPGITPAVLKRSIATAEARAKELKGLKCSIR
jgi:hypothetical protein